MGGSGREKGGYGQKKGLREGFKLRSFYLPSYRMSVCFPVISAG